jgi:subtilisin-like proprotein convertase family protein
MRQLLHPFLYLLLFPYISASGQGPLWSPIAEERLIRMSQTMYVQPEEGAYFEVDLTALEQMLNRQGHSAFPLPLPNGEVALVEATWSPAAAPGYFDVHPRSGTYRISGGAHMRIQGRIGHTIKGFHALYYLDGRAVMIDPVFREDTQYYAVYYQDRYYGDARQSPVFECQVADDIHDDTLLNEAKEWLASPRQSPTVDEVVYRFAVSTTGEYAGFHGGTVELVSAELLTVTNRLNSVLNVDLGVTLQLLHNNDLLINLNPATDGFTNGNPGAMIDQNPINIGKHIPLGAYDIGHALGTALSGGVVGLAELGCVCKNSKARGVSTLWTPQFDPFIINIVAHEVGHQFAATHSFNKCANESPGTGWEPGGGSTIMGYGGSCGVNSVQGGAGPYFHGGSIWQMRQFIQSGSGADCAHRIPTENLAPEVDLIYTPSFYIPISTPFKLEAEAWDPNGDELTYCWEQMDTGPITDAGSPIQNSPLFRSFPPTDIPVRYFPQLFRVAGNFYSRFEHLPDYSRDMTFRVTVRDQHPEAGGVTQRNVQFLATQAAGPFVVTSFNSSGVNLRHGDYVEVTWDPAGTDLHPVNCQRVNIRLSLNGGLAFPVVLAENVPNSGSFWVNIPEVNTNAARIMVEAADNIFFQMSLVNFAITAPDEPTFYSDIRPFVQTACIPNEVELTVSHTPVGGFSEPVTLAVTDGLPPGATAWFEPETVAPGETSILRMDISQVPEGGIYDFLIEASAPSGLLQTRPARLEIVRSDYRTLDALAPASGESGVGSSPLLAWQPQQDADRYRIELATSPAFGPHTLLSQYGITSSAYQVLQTLEPNTLYFWRVIPENVCGEASDTPVFAFHTVSLNCQDYTNDTTMLIPQQGSATSNIHVQAQGNTAAVFVPKILGSHQDLGDLRGTLRSPDGTLVRLWSSKCGAITGNINMGFNDESALPFACPPNKGETYRSEVPLSNLSGTSVNGVWSLVVQDIIPGNSGFLNSWTLRLCADINLTNPYFIRNEPLTIKPGSQGGIFASLLEVTDGNTVADALTFTVVRLPSRGELRKDGQALPIGAFFSQQDINEGRIAYRDQGLGDGEDHFAFTVQNGMGGWLGIDTFRIALDQSVSILPTSSQSFTLEVFPNPTSHEAWLRLSDDALHITAIRMFNSVGMEVPVAYDFTGSGLVALRIGQVPSGMYFLTVHTMEGQAAARIQVTR